MKKYKISAAVSTGDGWVNVITRDGTCVAALPESCRELLRRGMRIAVHYDWMGEPVAYSFAGRMVFKNPPITPTEIHDFVGKFKGLRNCSLDTARFTWALHWHMRKMGMVPMRNLVLDIMSYNYAHNLVR